jgi:hypothetical protein
MSHERLIPTTEEYRVRGIAATEQIELILATLPSTSMKLDVLTNVVAGLCLSWGHPPLGLAQQIGENVVSAVEIYQARERGPS